MLKNLHQEVPIAFAVVYESLSFKLFMPSNPLLLGKIKYRGVQKYWTVDL